MNRTRPTLALTLLLPGIALALACQSPAATMSTAGLGDAPQLSVEPDIARTSAWLHDIDRGPESFGPGSLEVEVEDSGDADGGSQFLELSALKVDVETVGSMARYEVEHVFHNHSDTLREGTFRFPLPSGAIVTGLAMEIDGKLQNGEILERERAREIYEEIVDSMRDPALLEWEAGQTFKLRVFPIQPDEKKRVVMRYMAPLVAHERSDSGFAVVIPSATPAMQTVLPSLVVNVDGRERAHERDHAARDNLTIPLDAASVPAYVEEQHEGQRYLSARVDLDWASVAEPRIVAGLRRTVILVDSSRSALESWPLARESVASLLDGLGPDEQFMLVAADLDAWVFADGFVDNSPQQRAAALAFLAEIEPDGASDLGRALARIGEALAEHERTDPALDQVVYIGDGTPTWGTSDRQTLVDQAQAMLGGAPLHALSVGKRESRDLLEALTGATGGRTVRPQSVTQVQAFNQFLDRAPAMRQLASARVEIPGLLDANEQLHGPVGTTWFEGERPVVHFRLAADQPVPSEVRVHGFAGGEAFEQVVAFGRPEALAGIRRQWVARELAEGDLDKAEAVELSVAHSVLSKHTAMLVLESEEAYERYAIERRNGPQTEGEGDPTISGRDLDGAGGDPYLGPGDLQPGDPEIHIPAPRDAVSVEVVFPFGETKAARWEQALGKWTVRFLVDDDTEPGTYAVLCRVTHADGRVEILELEYTIDVEAPQLRLELRARDDGAYDVYAHQILTTADAARERVEGRRPSAGQAEQPSTLDAKRVELVMPDGQTLTLRAGLPGQFVRRWAPRGELEWPAMVTAVIADRALNSRRVELRLDGPAATAGRSAR